jgi:hypothetical protein
MTFMVNFENTLEISLCTFGRVFTLTMRDARVKSFYLYCVNAELRFMVSHNSIKDVYIY